MPRGRSALAAAKRRAAEWTTSNARALKSVQAPSTGSASPDSLPKKVSVHERVWKSAGLKSMRLWLSMRQC